MSSKLKNKFLRNPYTDSLTYLSREALKDGLHTIASEIEQTRKKIELLDKKNGKDDE